MTDAAPSMRFGAQLWSQSTSWPDFRDAGVAAEAAGWDSLWTWDHLMAINGPWQQPLFEGWTSLAAWAALTSRVRVGLMVGANTFRNPGLTAKLATTLDHISGGRAVLGIGAAWFEREHEAHGIDFGASAGERLDRLDESVGLIRRLLDGETIDHSGRFYEMRDAVQAPLPVQPHLPILIGGSGPRKTLRIVARHADAWNTAGSYDDTVGRLAKLREHCRAVGRDPSTIQLTASFPILLRDSVEAAAAAFGRLLAHNGIEGIEGPPTLLGEPERVAETLRPYRDLGFRTIIVRLLPPFDRETIERIGEVADVLAD